MKSQVGVTERLARAAAAHPKRTLGAWGVAVIAALALVATSLHGLTSTAHVVGTPDSTKAANLIASAFPPTPADFAHQVTDVIVVSSAHDKATTPAFQGFVARIVSQVRSDTDVESVRSYLDGTPGLVSADRHAALIQLVVNTDSGIKPIVSLVQRLNGPAYSVSITGLRSADNDFGVQSQRDLENGELAIGLPAALVVLMLVFGAVVGGLVPVLMALLSIMVGLGVIAALTLEFTLSVFVVNMLTGMGLALGIDYSLFVISRYREERVGGRAKDEAIARAGATASRAVLFSGSTFVVALFGMLLVPTTIMRSLAAGAIVVGVVSVAAALTLLPALLALLGDRVNALRVPFVGRNLGRADRLEGRMWRAIVERVLARPAAVLIVTAALLLAAAVPIFGLHIGSNGVSTLPNSLPSKQGFLAVERYFPAQAPYPAQVVEQGGGSRAVAVLHRMQSQLSSSPHFGAGTVELAPAGDVAMLRLLVRGDPNSPAAVGAVRDLRSMARRELALTGATVHVGGHTAELADYYAAVTAPTPYVILFVLGLSMIVLTIAFRSIAVALVSIVLNLLSVGAAYGLLTLVFLKGAGASFFGFEHVAVVDAWVPLFLFSVLFGLSMDYQVFLMSRIKERVDQGASTRDAVASGIASTARIITGAALIIVAVFIGFASGKLVMFQQMGFSVAVALLIDATIIRSLVLPSMLALLGKRSWYLPQWLDWLPRVELDRAPVPSAT
jgi:putative drug exporter of the RND superfamily